MPGYRTKNEDVDVAGAASLHIRSLLDRRQFSDTLGLAARLGISSASWPMFGLLWPSGSELAARMAVQPLQPGLRILEIGCGLALASLVAHRRGADVTASDLHPLTARFLAINLRLNGLPPMNYRHGNWTDVDLACAVPSGPRANSALRGRFDLIIGSDVLYERDASQALAGFIGRHAAECAQVWIVDPDRSNRPAFTRRMVDSGFTLQDQRLDHPALGTWSAYKGRLLNYSRSG